MARTLRTLARRLLVEETGQDLIEYGLLTGIVAVGGVLVFTSIRDKMAAAYAGWGLEIQENWEPDPPSG
jgi:Flp pilus assembly pilin Flp